ncbi:MAG: glycosyltransferase [Streptococcaceae bacterium]|jgi:poly(glycerol-phosphate) alpha-glucosyltransferase|nr:glycosyltransferase [Streptococcaceae bacterium]
MKFFINSSFNKANSGIEHAQLKRADLFRLHGEPFKLVFREWSPRLHYFLSEVGVSAEETLGMFDYFQEAEDVSDMVLHVGDLDFGYSDIVLTKDEDTDYRYSVSRASGGFVGRVNLFADTDEERVSSVELFDAYGNLYRVDHYDFRGFKSLVQWYTPDNKIGTEVWYTVSGKPVLETFNKFDGTGNYRKMGWRLTDQKTGAVYSFANIDELTKHFYNCLNEDYWSDKELNIFVLDRTHLGDWALKELDRPCYVAFHLHNSHAGDANDVMHSVMNNFYEYGLTNINRYDAIISATPKQTHDVQARFAPESKLFTIPVGVNPPEVLAQKPISMLKRKAHSVLMTCRIAPEKGVGKVAEAIAIARKQIPDITLDAFGYIDHRDNDAAKKEIDAAIEKYKLPDGVINLHDYLDKEGVAREQQSHQVYALMSIMEGFNLALMEAQANGEVTVTNDVNYGPNDLVVNEENGYIVAYDGIEEMAEKFVELFKDDDKLQEMSDKAYKLSERFSEENVWQAWQELLDDAKTKSFSYIKDASQGYGNQEVKK